MKRSFILLFALVLLFNSCQFVDNIFHKHRGDRMVARIGSDVLYESEIVKLMPAEVSSQDSTYMVDQYIKTWSQSKLLLLKAEEFLSKSEKDVTTEVEEFRQTLLGFRYEKLYVEERLDTVVTKEDALQYFQDHQHSFTFPYSIVRARVVRLYDKSPYYEMIKSGFQVTSEQDVLDLEELCNASADRYVDFNKQWIAVSALAREIESDVASCEGEIAKKRFFEIKTDTYVYMVYVQERVAPNEVSPFEYNLERIRENLLSKRKQDLLAKLERDLLEDAINNKTLKIYKKNE